MEKCDLPDGHYLITGLSTPRNATLVHMNDNYHATVDIPIDRFRELFNVYKAGKLFWNADQPLGKVENGVITEITF